MCKSSVYGWKQWVYVIFAWYAKVYVWESECVCVVVVELAVMGKSKASQTAVNNKVSY